MESNGSSNLKYFTPRQHNIQTETTTSSAQEAAMLSNNDTPFDIPSSSPSQMVKSNEVIVLTRFPSAPSALTVHVGLDSHGGPQTSFRVDRDKMCLASLVWSHMLMPYGQFGESSNCDIPFPDDAPDAMEIVLVIIHSGPRYTQWNPLSGSQNLLRNTSSRLC